MRVLIIGGAGFVGANLAIYLSQNGHTVTVMDNLVRRGSELNLSEFAQNNIEFCHGDARNMEDFPLAPVDIVLDCAAQPSAIDGYKNPRYDFTNNTFGTLNILEFCRKNDAGLIFWSTNKVYPQWAVHDRKIEEMETRFSSTEKISENTPLDGGDRSLYGASKIMSDLMIQEWSSSFDIPAIINRFSCIGGSRQWGKPQQGWVAWWVIAHYFGLKLKYYGYNGKQVRDVLFIDDLTSLIAKQMERLSSGHSGVYNIGGSDYCTMSLIECTKICEEVTGNKILIENVIDGERRADFKYYVSDISKAEGDFDWRPEIDPIEGIERIHEWVDANKLILSKMYG